MAKSITPSFGALIRAALLAPLFAAYGAWRVMVIVVGLLRRGSTAARLLGATLPCPSCHHANALAGRWDCATCGGTFHGFVGRCALCGAGAAFFPCEACGVSIPLGVRP